MKPDYSKFEVCCKGKMKDYIDNNLLSLIKKIILQKTSIMQNRKPSHYLFCHNQPADNQ
jgi:hypothetical protein